MPGRLPSLIAIISFVANVITPPVHAQGVKVYINA